MRKKRPPAEHTVTAEHNGTEHSAPYTVESGVVIVRYGMATNQALARNSPVSVARLLLLEILQGKKWQF